MNQGRTKQRICVGQVGPKASEAFDDFGFAGRRAVTTQRDRPVHYYRDF